MVKYIRLCERICVIKILVKITLIMVAFLQIHIIINNCRKIKIKIKKIKKLLKIWANLSVK
jgi:hypothetical protein